MFWNNIFRICVKPCYEYNVLIILTLKMKIEEIRCIWKILYQMPLWNSFHCILSNENKAFSPFYDKNYYG